MNVLTGAGKFLGRREFKLADFKITRYIPGFSTSLGFQNIESGTFLFHIKHSTLMRQLA
jgi:hypothetical protein